MTKNQFRSIIKAKIMASRIVMKENKQPNIEDKMKKEMKAQAKETWKQSKTSGIRLKKPKYRIINDNTDNTDNTDFDLDQYFEDLNKFDPYGLVSDY